MTDPLLEVEYSEKQNPPLITKSPKFPTLLSDMKQCDNSSYVIIADYDCTFTRLATNNRMNRSSFQVIYESPLANEDFKIDTNNLQNKYKKYESDCSHDFQKRKQCMLDWYTESLKLIVTQKYTRKNIIEFVEDSIKTSYVLFRNGVKKFFELIEEKNIPLILVSGGIKEVIVEELIFLLGKEKYDSLKAKKLLYITANYFIYKDEVVADFKKPIIYTFNKDEMVNLENENLKKNDTNIIFLGDHLNDADTIKLIKRKNLIKIGFANYKQDEVPEEYYKVFDVVVKDDGDFWVVNEIIENICN